MCVSNFQGNLSLNGPNNHHSIAPGNHYYEFSVVLYVKVDIPKYFSNRCCTLFSLPSTIDITDETP